MKLCKKLVSHRFTIHTDCGFEVYIIFNSDSDSDSD